MSIYIKYLIVNALLIFGLIRKKENKVFIIISSVIEALVSGLLILEIAGISLTPKVFCAVIAVMLLWGLTEVMIVRKVFFSVVCAVFAVICAVTFVACPACTEKTVQNTDYYAVYSKWTGIGETKVMYHEKYNGFFMKSDADFTENYGILFCSEEEIFDNEPISVEK